MQESIRNDIENTHWGLKASIYEKHRIKNKGVSKWLCNGNVFLIILISAIPFYFFDKTLWGAWETCLVFSLIFIMFKIIGIAIKIKEAKE